MAAERPDNRGTLKTNARSTSKINIRYAPDGEAVKTDRPQGTEVSVIAESTIDSKGHRWYKVIYGSAENDVGWVRDDVISINSPDWKKALETKEDLSVSDANTRLSFDTRQLSVRVFGPSGKLRLNIYNKVSKKTQLYQARAMCLPDIVCAPVGSDILWKSYVAEQDDRAYIARFVPFHQVELIISDAITGEIIDQVSGFGSKGTAYQGQ